MRALKCSCSKTNLLINSPGGERLELQWAYALSFEFPDYISQMHTHLRGVHGVNIAVQITPFRAVLYYCYSSGSIASCIIASYMHDVYH